MDTNNKRVFSGVRVLYILAVFVLLSTVVACAGGSKKEETKGSLMRTFTIVDENGRKSGTLTIDPFGVALLRDENGNVIGSFKSVSPAAAQPPAAQPPAAQPAAAQPAETQPSKDQPQAPATQ